MQLSFGPHFHGDGTVTFRLWAPGCSSVSIVLSDRPPCPMEREDDGYFSLRIDALRGDLYAFDIGKGFLLPDPASRFQPDGVHGKSQLVDLPLPASDWPGIAKENLIIYELHVGTFTEKGDYVSAAARLPELVELGITAIELMPLAQCAGQRNWGYDGVGYYAPHHACGTPEELRDLIEVAHSLGIAVILDVVYNHLGPEGNYLGLFGGYLSRTHSTPWGDAPNYDEESCAVLRRFILENIVYWIEGFGFDGLRLDATHCLADNSQPHIVREIGETCRHLEEKLGRALHLIAESNIYDPELLLPLEKEGFGFDALWCDDFIHSIYASLAPGEHLSDRRYQPGEDLDLMLRRGYIFHGTLQTKRERHLLEHYPEKVGVESIVAAIQNHDFIGNHPRGLRLHQKTSLEAQRSAAALLLLSPSIPMLFMGEEFATESPFYFFTDFGDPKIRRAVEKGRKAEHPQHDWKNAVSPLSGEAFEESKIGPAESGSVETRTWYRRLIQIRKQWKEEGLLKSECLDGHWDSESATGILRYSTADGAKAFLLVRLHPADEPPTALQVQIDGELLLSQNYEETKRQVGEFAVLLGRGSIEVPPTPN